MRRSLVGLQLLLACVLVWGTSVPAEPNLEEPGKLDQTPAVPEESNSEEMEEREKEYRERMQRTGGTQYSVMFLKHAALDFFHKQSSADAFYRPVEDTDIEVKSAYGTILTFTLYLVNTNCTKEEGRKSSAWWLHEFESQKVAPCVVLPEQQQKKLRCRVRMFLDAGTEPPIVLRQYCEPVVFLKDSDDVVDVDQFVNHPTQFD